MSKTEMYAMKLESWKILEVPENIELLKSKIEKLCVDPAEKVFIWIKFLFNFKRDTYQKN